MQATFDHTETVGPNVRTLWFQPERPLRFAAGQFVELYLPGTFAGNNFRQFTISSSPHDPLLGITVRFDAVQLSAYKRALAALQPGDHVRVLEPMGDFVLPKASSIPLVFVAAGIGITPFKSMLEWLAEEHEQRPIQLLQAARTPDLLLFQDVIKAYGIVPTLLVSQPDTFWHGTTGHLTAGHILKIMPSDPETLIYIAGPETLVDTLRVGLMAQGIDNARIVTDRFTGYQATY
jgi:ferredoxin-NADP reductase